MNRLYFNTVIGIKIRFNLVENCNKNFKSECNKIMIQNKLILLQINIIKNKLKQNNTEIILCKQNKYYSCIVKQY